MLNKLKQFVSKVFGKVASEELQTPELIEQYVKKTANEIYPPQSFEDSDPFYRVTFSTLLQNEINYVARKYSRAGVKPSFDELVDVLSTQVKLTAALTSASESLSYISGVQAINGPVGQLFILKYKSDGLSSSLNIDSAAVQATGRLGVAVRNLTPEPSINDAWYGNLVSAPSTNQLQQIADSAFKVGLEVVRDVVKELVETVPTAKTLKGLGETIRNGTRRGYANFVLVNAKSLEALKSHYTFNPAGRSQSGTPYISEVGIVTIDDQILSVFEVDSPILDTTALVGYKGSNGQTDAGFFVAPYVTNGTDLIDGKVLVRYGTLFTQNGHAYYKTVPLKIKAKRKAKAPKSPVVESP